MTQFVFHYPALSLCVALFLALFGFGVLVLACRAYLRGMGRGPMSSGSRAVCPTAWSGAPLARLPVVSLRPTVKQGATGRVMEHGLQPRPGASVPAWPDSRLKDKRAGGAPALRCAHGEGGDSGEKHSFLEELAPQLPLSGFPESIAASGGATGVCASRKGRGLCPSPACPATCAHVGRQSECGQVPDRDSGRPHLHGVVGVLVHAGGTGAAFDRSPSLWKGVSS